MYEYEIKYSNRIEEIQDLVKETTNKTWLSNFLSNVSEKINTDTHYVWIKSSNSDTALLIFEVVTLSIDELSSYANSQNVLCPNFPLKLIQTIIRRPNFRILIHGFSFLTGDYGFLSEKENLDRPEYLRQALTLLSEKIRFDGVLIKDINLSNHFKTPSKYVKFQIDPNMVFYPNFSKMSTYVDSLKTKYRQRYKATMNKSSELEVRILGSKDVLNFKLEIHKLFNAILKEDKFTMGRISENYFVELSQLKEVSFYGYFLKDELVGFRSSIHADQTHIAHFIGYLEEVNESSKIYLRMLYDFVEEGISTSAEKIYFGRTALEIKSTIGAQPQELDLFLYIKGWFFRRLTYPFFNRLKTTLFISRSVFKA